MQRHWWLACPECLASCPAPTHLASSSSLTAHPSNLKRPLNSHCQGEETEAAPAPKLVQPLRSRPGVRCHHWKRPLNILSPTLTLASVSHHHRDPRTGTLVGRNRSCLAQTGSRHPVFPGSSQALTWFPLSWPFSGLPRVIQGEQNREEDFP